MMIRMPKAMAPPRRKLLFFCRLRLRKLMRSVFITAPPLFCLNGLNRLNPQGHAHRVETGHDANSHYDPQRVEQ